MENEGKTAKTDSQSECVLESASCKVEHEVGLGAEYSINFPIAISLHSFIVG